MKTTLKTLLFILLSVPLIAARNPGNSNNNPAPSAQTPPVAPKYIDPVNGYMLLYDTNHDGQLDMDELKKMSKLDPMVYTQAMVFAKEGVLGVEEISQWRNYLKNKWDLEQQEKKNSGNPQSGA